MLQSLRVTIALLAIVTFGVCSSVAVRAQDGNSVFASAQRLEAEGKDQEALNAYGAIHVNNQANNPEVAGEALYLGGLFAQDPLRYGKNDQEKRDGQATARRMWQDLRDNLNNTRAFRNISDPMPGAPAGRYVALLEKVARPHDVLAEYNRIERENAGKSPELAAQALYHGGLFARDHNGSTPDEKRLGADQAWLLWKKLRDEHPKTRAYSEMMAPTATMQSGQLAGLESSIDLHNSKDWKYKIIGSLVALTGSTPAFSYGLALILIAVLVKIIVLPLTKKQYAGMREMQRMQPLMVSLKQKYKGQELSAKTMELYKEHGVNPFASCLPTLVQIPFLIGVYTAIREYEIAFGKGHFLWIGSGIAEGSPVFMGAPIIAKNLAHPDLLLLILYMVTQYITMRMTPSADPAQEQQQKTMALMTSGLFFWMFLSYKWSSAFVLYWFVLNLLTIWQQWTYVYKPFKVSQANGGTPPTTGSGAVKNGAGAATVNAIPIAVPTRVRPRKKKK